MCRCNNRIIILSVILLWINTTAWSAVEKSFDLWDWTKPCQDISLFEEWVNDLAEMGFNRIEISTPWRLLEPSPGTYDLSFISDRLAICKKAGVGMRLRINSYWKGAVPDWYSGDIWMDIDGNQAGVLPFKIPSITDERFWINFAPLVTSISERFKGEDIYYNAFIGVHAELKWANWCSYDPSTLTLWRKSIQSPRPQWLKRIVNDEVVLPDKPQIPQETTGLPDNTPASKAFIAFREMCWRQAVKKFTSAIQAGDSNARISSPLGESFRRQSAIMSNLDYWGLSRGSDQIVHSYDFFWHNNDPSWQVEASISAFRGITSLPTVLEFDGPNLFTNHGYDSAKLLALAQRAARCGSGLKIANYSYLDSQLPSSIPFLREIMSFWNNHEKPHPVMHDKSKTILLFMSKWANYCYRENTEWLHSAQFGAYRILWELGIPVRIICEDNLSEDLSGYRGIYIAFSPPELIPDQDRNRLGTLDLPTIIELPSTPQKINQADKTLFATGSFGKICVKPAGFKLGPCDVNLPDSLIQADHTNLVGRKGKKIILGYPLGYVFVNGPDPDSQLGLLAWAITKITEN